jgi:hypothetical protein
VFFKRGMEDFAYDARHVIDLPADAGHSEGGRDMSEEREKKFENDDETATEDVEAHVKKGREASDEGEDGGDDVEAHVKQGRQ